MKLARRLIETLLLCALGVALAYFLDVIVIYFDGVRDCKKISEPGFTCTAHFSFSVL